MEMGIFSFSVDPFSSPFLHPLLSRHPCHDHLSFSSFYV
ncbi:hypothetical protein OIU77_007340 [Salix suchowensis]|uniref:Uncharacterized protein n=1 Tax=Salix suchowensis TaxID=1278906 RepID=A0ABQ9AFS5_9ROSI|nr:hypothetical protein OIU77_007340 [Salix suchowensis]